MKRIIKKILFIGLIIFLLIQLYQPARNISFEQDITGNFTKVYNVPKNVEIILRTSCYDCHSNNTYYPWYSYIQPVRFFMESHIKEGKENLNFNEWGTYSNRKQERLLNSIKEQIETKQMPLSSYTIMHENAKLNDEQIKVLTNWLKEQE